MPPAERQRLSLVARLALAELHAGRDPDQALVDLTATAIVCQALLAGGDYSQEAHEAVKSAAGALQSAAAGTTPHSDAAGACGPLVEVFETLVRSVPLRRVQAALDEVATL